MRVIVAPIGGLRGRVDVEPELLTIVPQQAVALDHLGARRNMGDRATQRPSPAASGTLGKTPLLHLLVYALEKKLEGTMDIVSPDHRVASVLFVGGEPAKAHLSEPVLYLGQVLLELGYMTAEVLDHALAELEDVRGAGARPLCGEFLGIKALVDPASVEAAFREQIARRLRYVASMPPETTYAYYDGFDALRGIGVDSPRGVDPLPMLWPLLGDSAPRAHIDAALARVSGASLRIAKSADLARLGLGAAERDRYRAAAHPPADGGGVLRASAASPRTTRACSRTCCS